MITDQMVEAGARGLDADLFAKDQYYDHPNVARKRNDALEISRMVLTAALGDAGWQDISTVPKDGFEIDLWCLNVSDGAEARFAEMFWNESGKWEDWRSYILETKWKPTHWMRTPEGPTVTRHNGDAATVGV